jgi:hypothetical protein
VNGSAIAIAGRASPRAEPERQAAEGGVREAVRDEAEAALHHEHAEQRARDAEREAGAEGPLHERLAERGGQEVDERAHHALSQRAPGSVSWSWPPRAEPRSHSRSSTSAGGPQARTTLSR